VLETVDYQSVQVNLTAERPEFKLKPSEYFRRQVYGCYWFEKQLDQSALDAIGTDNILFETDFPHPTSLYAEEVARTIDTGIGRADPVLRRKVLIDNAAKLYKLKVPEQALAA
jgi:predicted TIM-barrel fold metal-dependent hydrolase